MRLRGVRIGTDDVARSRGRTSATGEEVTGAAVTGDAAVVKGSRIGKEGS